MFGSIDVYGGMESMFKPPVGKFEDIVLINCRYCETENVFPVDITRNHSKREFEGSLKCQGCKEDFFEPRAYYGRKFACPKCGKENCQVVEPTGIIQTQLGKLSKHAVDTITCMHCETEFRLAIGITGPDPTFWRRELYER